MRHIQCTGKENSQAKRKLKSLHSDTLLKKIILAIRGHIYFLFFSPLLFFLFFFLLSIAPYIWLSALWSRHRRYQTARALFLERMCCPNHIWDFLERTLLLLKEKEIPGLLDWRNIMRRNSLGMKNPGF